MIAAVLSPIGRWISGLLVGAMALLGVFAAGRRTQRKSQKVDDLEDFIETQEKVNAVSESPDRDAAIERLRANGLIR